jgi:hypothetical protein
MKRLRHILFFILPLLVLITGGRLTAADTVPPAPQKSGYHKQESVRSSEGLHTVSIRITEYNAPARYTDKHQKTNVTGDAAAFHYAGASRHSFPLTSHAAAVPQGLPRFLALRRLLI